MYIYIALVEAEGANRDLAAIAWAPREGVGICKFL